VIPEERKIVIMATQTVLEPEERISSVHLDGLAVLKLVKHCQESLPVLVMGSLLGMTAGNGVLEVTHSFPFPEALDDKSSPDVVKGVDEAPSAAVDEEMAALEGHEFQLEMMKKLREVNVDHNCVGWYQSMYLGSYSTAALVETQLSYQTDMSPNAVVILYDPIQTAHGDLVLKCFRLTDECVALKTEENPKKKNAFLDPSKIFEEIPITFTNPGLVRCLLHDLKASDTAKATVSATDTTFDRLDLSTNPYLEKHLEFLSKWVDDLAAEQYKFQSYTRTLARNASSANKHHDKRRNKEFVLDSKTAQEGWESTDAPRRMESLLITNQIRSYCDQVDKFAGGGFGKLFLASGLHKEEATTPAAVPQSSA
jgi:translation initiation factor 3 subunit H